MKLLKCDGNDQRRAGPSNGQGGGAAPARENAQKGLTPGSGKSAAETGSRSRQVVLVDPLDGWRKSLYSAMSSDAQRRMQALLAAWPPPGYAAGLADSHGRSVRGDHRGNGARFPEKDITRLATHQEVDIAARKPGGLAESGRRTAVLCSRACRRVLDQVRGLRPGSVQAEVNRNAEIPSLSPMRRYNWPSRVAGFPASSYGRLARPRHSINPGYFPLSDFKTAWKTTWTQLKTWRVTEGLPQSGGRRSLP